MHITDKKLAALESWLFKQEVILHPSLRIKQHRPAEYGVYATSDIPADTIIMQVPKEALLSPRTCGISNLLQDSEDLDGMTAVCLAYLYERHQGSDSPWRHYLACCPLSVNISKLWNKQDQRILKGSEVGMVGGTTLSDFKETYAAVVKRFLQRHKDALGSFGKLSFQDFCQGMSVVGSRAFEIDAYHGLALCPFADMLDHEVDEHVHFQTAFDVCPDCGEYGDCEHDPDSEMDTSSQEDDDDEDDADMKVIEDDEYDDDAKYLGETNDNEAKRRVIEPHKYWEQHSHKHVHGSNCDHDHDVDAENDDLQDDCCDFVVARPIRAGSQLYNTYGDLGNDVLLARYGFALRHNPHDKISLAKEVFARYPMYRDWVETNGENLCRALRREDGDDFMQGEEPAKEDMEFEDELFVDFTGLPSESLLVYLFISTIPIDQLEQKTGQEVLAMVQVLRGAWQYVQPGRMPLPKFLFLEAAKSVLEMSSGMKQVLATRRERYALPYSQLTRERKASHDQYAMIVRDCEERILQRSEAYLAMIERACAWLLSR